MVVIKLLVKMSVLFMVIGASWDNLLVREVFEFFGILCYDTK